MRISDWSSDVCSSDQFDVRIDICQSPDRAGSLQRIEPVDAMEDLPVQVRGFDHVEIHDTQRPYPGAGEVHEEGRPQSAGADDADLRSGEHLLSEQPDLRQRSEEHTSELQSL